VDEASSIRLAEREAHEDVLTKGSCNMKVQSKVKAGVGARIDDNG